MKIEIVLVAEESTAPEPGPVTYALALGVSADGGEVDYDSLRVLQRGYSTPKHALGALFECLSFAPPDLSTYDEGLANLSGLMDRTRDLEDAMTAVGGRLNEAEERLEGMAGPAAPATSRLLPPRAGSPRVPAAGQPVAPVPSIRQARRTVVSAGHGAGGKVNGSAPLTITGGVGARGNLGPTGPGTDVDSDGEIE